MKITRQMTHPDKAQARIKQLRKEGASMATIREATGISIARLHVIERGEADLIEKETARKILKLKNPTPGAWQDATGTSRRLQALAAIGYTLTMCSEGLEVTEGNITKARIGAHQYVRYATMQKVKAFYEEHKDTPAPISPLTKRAATFAKKYGWLPPAAWEGHDIDDPSVSPGEYDGVNKQ